MGAVGGLLGLGSGAAGTSFAGPQQANITAPTNTQQINQAYTGTQNSLAAQNNLLSALQAQNGLGNQSQVYGQLQGIASGAVNPAQAQFAQNTSQNVANQAALMAGQRGANQNVGLIARQAAQQGAATQQQAVGQEAAQQAQNQINAIGAAGNLATTQAQQQIGQTNANAQAQQAEQSNLLNALQGYNTNQVQSQASVNAANASLAGTQMQGQQGLIGGVMNGVGAIAGLAAGGDVQKMASGGSAGGPQSSFGQFVSGVSGGQANANNGNAQPIVQQSGPGALQQGMSNLIQGVYSGLKSPIGSNVTMDNGTVAGPSNNYGAATLTNPGISAPAPQAPGLGSFQLPSSDSLGGTAAPTLTMPAFGAAKGGIAKDFRGGGKVNASSPKQKAVAKGNSYSNDKIPAVLSEHEIVLPRSVTLSKDPVREAAKFVQNVIAKRRGGK